MLIQEAMKETGMAVPRAGTYHMRAGINGAGMLAWYDESGNEISLVA